MKTFRTILLEAAFEQRQQLVLEHYEILPDLKEGLITKFRLLLAASDWMTFRDLLDALDIMSVSLDLEQIFTCSFGLLSFDEFAGLCNNTFLLVLEEKGPLCDAKFHWNWHPGGLRGNKTSSILSTRTIS